MQCSQMIVRHDGKQNPAVLADINKKQMVPVRERRTRHRARGIEGAGRKQASSRCSNTLGTTCAILSAIAAIIVVSRSLGDTVLAW